MPKLRQLAELAVPSSGSERSDAAYWSTILSQRSSCCLNSSVCLSQRPKRSVEHVQISQRRMLHFVRLWLAKKREKKYYGD